MLVLSHRGYHVAAPENTIEAFALAGQMGVDGIETDLRLTSDGRCVLFHDRIVPDGREVAALSHDEIIEAVGYPVPTLEEALGGFDGLFWNLELKVPETLASALTTVRKFAGSKRRFLITSFWHNAVRDCRDQIAADAALANRTDLAVGLLTADRPVDLGCLGEQRFGPGELQAIVWYFDVLDPVLIEQARARGIANYAYGLKTVADHRRCVELGLEGIITDRPEMMAQARLLH
jgi:glycerophosphoryl diester phosphodiesterase